MYVHIVLFIFKIYILTFKTSFSTSYNLGESEKNRNEFKGSLYQKTGFECRY